MQGLDAPLSNDRKLRSGLTGEGGGKGLGGGAG